ncbi:hypothetical protein MRB53_040760 [Persea americana]|nr:hypothetical protein MRB53_040760 [Persea americana]
MSRNSDHTIFLSGRRSLKRRSTSLLPDAASGGGIRKRSCAALQEHAKRRILYARIPPSPARNQEGRRKAEPLLAMKSRRLTREHLSVTRTLRRRALHLKNLRKSPEGDSPRPVVKHQSRHVDSIIQLNLRMSSTKRPLRNLTTIWKAWLSSHQSVVQSSNLITGEVLGFNQPMYAADMPGSLFDDKTTSWNVAKLENLLDVLGTKVPGVNTAYLYMECGKQHSRGIWRMVDLYSINYIHFGAPKQWYSISQEDARKFERAMRTVWPSDAKVCDQFLRHKTYLISPDVLQKQYGVKVNKLVQL